jgi:hypothetical protein
LVNLIFGQRDPGPVQFADKAFQNALGVGLLRGVREGTTKKLTWLPMVLRWIILPHIIGYLGFIRGK